VVFPLPSRITAVQESEESARAMSFQKFKNQGTDYYGDVDEMDVKLVEEEEEMEIEGESP
jgi:hypothetical protein